MGDLDMRKKSVKDLSDADLKGKRVFVRCDLNVPQNKETLEVTDDTRIRGSVETLKYLASKGAKVMAASHLGRPKDGFEKKFSLEPVAPVLSKYLGQDVKLVSDCIGTAVSGAVDAMKDGDIVLLENVRFYPRRRRMTQLLLRSYRRMPIFMSMMLSVPRTEPMVPLRVLPLSLDLLSQVSFWRRNWTIYKEPSTFLRDLLPLLLVDLRCLPRFLLSKPCLPRLTSSFWEVVWCSPS